MNYHRNYIARANELGYFPTSTQAKEISMMAAERYGQLRADGLAPKTGAIPDHIGRECDEWAIRRVMDHLFVETISGVAGDDLSSQVIALIRKVEGKSIRVRIEEF